MLECYQGVVPGQEPPGPVVSVLTARLQVEIIKAPVLQLLTEVLNTNLAQSHPALLTDWLTHPLGQVELVSPVETKDGVKVPGRSVKVILSLLKGICVAQFLQSWTKQNYFISRSTLYCPPELLLLTKPKIEDCFISLPTSVCDTMTQSAKTGCWELVQSVPSHFVSEIFQIIDHSRFQLNTRPDYFFPPTLRMTGPETILSAMMRKGEGGRAQSVFSSLTTAWNVVES